MRPQSTVFRHRARTHEELEGATKVGVISEATEAENDALMKALLGDVRSAKRQFVAMGSEVQRQNALLEGLEAVFSRARMRLGRTLRHLDSVGLSSFKHIWLLFVFAVIVFMFIYLMLKFR